MGAVEELDKLKATNPKCYSCKEKKAEGALHGKEGQWVPVCKDCFRQHDDNPYFDSGTMPW